jgi:basic membrane protein A and related proteins
MSRRFWSVALTLALLVTLLPVGPTAVAREGEMPPGGVSVFGQLEPGIEKAGLVSDTNGFGDNGFNDAALVGLEMAGDDWGIATDSRASTADEYFGPNIDSIVSDGSELVFTVGWLMQQVTQEKASEYPDTLFAGIDTAFEDPPGNLVGVQFKEHEAAYLAGVLAGLGTLDEDLDDRINPDNVIAFIGGMEIPVVQRFEAGFVAGARSVNPHVEVLVSYAGVFDDEGLGYDLASEAIDAGADIVFAAAGGTGLGAISACQDVGALFIGVDVDQYLTVPGSGDVMLTSVMKHVDRVVYLITTEAYEGVFVGGRNRWFGLAEDAVGLAPYHDFDASVSQEIKDAVQAAKSDISNGIVEVPADPIHSDWVFNPDTGTYYLFVDYGLSWPDAEAYANECGGHLVTINDAEEEAWLLDRFSFGYWIGFNDIDVEGVWVWSSGEPVTYTNWFDGEPSNTGGNEQAAVLDDWGSGPGWNDMPPEWEVAFVVEASTPLDPPFLGDPFFNVNPVWNEIWGSQWLPNAGVNVFVGDLESPDVDEVVETDERGNFGLTDFEYDIKPGDLVTVTDGLNSRQHTVTELAVLGADPGSDTVWGTASADAQVTVDLWFWNDNYRVVTADSVTGEWAADFSVPGPEEGQEVEDLVPGRRGAANECDEDGDATVVPWSIPNPHFRVNAASDAIWGHDWPAEQTLTITIDDGEEHHVFYADVDKWGDFDLPLEGAFDLQEGHTVTVTDGTTTKTHVVAMLQVTEVNLADASIDPNTVKGTTDAPAGSHIEVHVWIHDEWRMRHVEVQPDGSWVADFGEAVGDEEEWQQPCELVRGVSGVVEYHDDDGDVTHVDWDVPNPHFNVNPESNSIWGHDWPPNAGVNVFVGDTDDPDVDVVVPTDEWGNFSLDDLGGYDIVPGDVVTVTDGETSKVHVVTELRDIEVDVTADVVSGWAAPHSELDVWINDGPGYWIQADGSGYWEADFSGEYDIGPGTEGAANQGDEDGDSTFISWRVANPVIRVNPIDDIVWGHEWPPNAGVNVFVGDPENPDLDEVVETDEWGNFWFTDFDYDIEPGDLVTVTDGETSKTHTVVNLAVLGVDPDTDTVWGTGEPGAEIRVGVHDTGRDRGVTVEPDGTWTADFTQAAGPDESEQPWDIVGGTDGYAMHPDEDWDATWIDWRVANPVIQVNPRHDDIWGHEWRPNEEVNVFVGDPDNPDVDVVVDTDEWGYFLAEDLGDYDIVAGDTVTVTDGTTTKTHVVTIARVTAVALDADTVHGIAEPGSEITVNVHLEEEWLSRTVTADAETGAWVADFSVSVGPEPWERAHDIDPVSVGNVEQGDDDGDMTWIPWELSQFVDLEVPPGSDVAVPVTVEVNGEQVEITVVFDQVTEAGTLIVSPLPSAPAGLPDGFMILGNNRFDISFTGEFAGSIEIGFPYDPAIPDARARNLKVMHWMNNGWTDATRPLDPVDTIAKLIWARVSSLSPFVLVEPTEPPPASISIEGASRFDTAVAASQEAYPDGSQYVIIATGRNWPDALGGTALAGALDAPILLSEPTSLPSVTKTEIERLEATHAIILGGTGAVSAGVQNTLATMGLSVERIAGTTRYQTADAVALRTIAVLGASYDGTAFVATGGNFPDALAAAPLAAANGWPLYLAHPTSGLLPGTVAAMGAVEEALILGGTGAVSAGVESALDTLLGGSQYTTRLQGINRYVTAVAIASHGVSDAGHTWDRVGIATGEDYPDALAGGVLQGKVGSVMLLTLPTTLHASTATALTANAGAIDTVTFFGGTGAVSTAVRQAALAAAGIVP